MSKGPAHRSYFQPAPRRKEGDDDYSLPYRRPGGSPYRSASLSRRYLLRNALRILVFILSFLLIDRVTDFRHSAWCQRLLYGKGVVKTEQQWREKYDSLNLGFQGLPESFPLPGGGSIPSVGLGTWKSYSTQVGTAVKAALGTGYRHIDTAWSYGNEQYIGDALQEMLPRYPRESLFITSKLWNIHHHPDSIEPALDQTLSRLQTDYLDLYLMHFPVAQNLVDGKLELDKDFSSDQGVLATWRKMEHMVRLGKVKHLGVSNFNIRRLQNLTQSDIQIQPVVNQVELNYWNPQPELVKFAKEHNILLEAYSPLGGDGMVARTLKLPVVKRISKALGITPAQVIISWHVQRGTVVLPKSTDQGRISEDYQLFTLPKDMFNELENAATSHRPHRLLDPSESWGIDIFEDNKEDD